MKAAAPISVSLRPSRRLVLIQAVAHAAAAGAVIAAQLPLALALALLAAVGVSAVRVRGFSPPGVLVLGGDGGLRIVGADGTAIEAAVHPHTVALHTLVVLLYRHEGRIGSLVLLGDSASPEDLRQLRLWLRWRVPVAQGAPSP